MTFLAIEEKSKTNNIFASRSLAVGMEFAKVAVKHNNKS